QAIVRIVSQLVREGIAPKNIAVLTPYRGQLRALTDRLRQAGIPLDDPERDPVGPQQLLFAPVRTGGVAVGTVHRFQGGERDVVIFSAVISQSRSLAFTNQRVNLINVAVSRARKHLVVVGNRKLLARGRITRELVGAIADDNWVAV
ncbi:MAG: superfamily I DNA and/or RNA helicase, partial [Myxococcota bacterium]